MLCPFFATVKMRKCKSSLDMSTYSQLYVYCKAVKPTYSQTSPPKNKPVSAEGLCGSARTQGDVDGRAHDLLYCMRACRNRWRNTSSRETDESDSLNQKGVQYTDWPQHQLMLKTKPVARHKQSQVRQVNFTSSRLLPFPPC